QYRTEQIEAVLQELSPFKQTRFTVAVDDLEKAMAEKESIVKQARENFSQLERQNLEQLNARKEVEQKQCAQILDEVVEGLRDPKHGLPIFQTKDGDSEWNSKVNERLETLKALHNGEYNERDKARWNAWAVAAPSLLETCKSQAAEIERLTTQLKEQQVAQPTIEAQAGKQGQAQQNPEGSFMRRYNDLYTPGKT